MKLPLIGQQCIVTYRGKKHIGTVRECGTNYKGQYRVGVWGFNWGLTIDFRAEDVFPLEVRLDDGSRYSAREAYLAAYTKGEQEAHRLADEPEATPPATPVKESKQPATAGTVRRISRGK